MAGRPHLVPPPTTETALLLVALAPGAAQGDEQDAALWDDTLRAWLPEALAQALRSPEGRSVERHVVTHLLFEGSPLPRQAVAKYLGTGTPPRDGEDMLAAMLRFDAADAIGRVSTTFAATPMAVLGWPWPMFLLWLREVGRVRAQQSLSALTVQSLPHIRDEHERRTLLSRMQVLAGARDEEAARTPEERAAHAQVEMDRLKRAMMGG